MMRPRNILIAACPWLSNNDASQVLRNAGGDIEKAKRQAMQAGKMQRMVRIKKLNTVKRLMQMQMVIIVANCLHCQRESLLVTLYQSTI